MLVIDIHGFELRGGVDTDNGTECLQENEYRECCHHVSISERYTTTVRLDEDIDRCCLGWFIAGSLMIGSKDECTVFLEQVKFRRRPRASV